MMYSFNFPQAVWVIILFIPLIVGFFYLNLFRRSQLHFFASPLLSDRLLTPRSLSITITKQFCWFFIWILGCFALMEPIKYIYDDSSDKNTNLIKEQPPQEIIFLVDTSASMSVPDGSNQETRLEEAKKIIIDMIRQLNGQNISLYAFTSILTPIVPSTLDYLFTRLTVGELHIDEGDIGGTNFSKILNSLNEEIFNPPSFQHYSFVLFSDGEDQGFENLSIEEKNEQIKKITQVLPETYSSLINFYTVGLGSNQDKPIPNALKNGKPVFSKLDSDVLIQLAQKWNGIYYEASKWHALNLARELTEKINENAKVKIEKELSNANIPVENQPSQYQVYYQIPLSIALLFYLLNLSLPDIKNHRNQNEN